MRRQGAGWGLLGALLLVAPVWAQPTAKPEAFSDGTPPIVKTLGAERTVKLTAVNNPNGKVVWFNSRLATEMGIELPRGHAMTPELEAKLMRHLSWQVLPKGEAAGSRPTVDVFADKYGGWGMGYNKGAGRAAFFGPYNLNIKGIGVTPLVSTATHYSHRHGGAPLSEGVLEAVWGEVNSNLFNRGGTRIIAVIDVGEHTEWEDGGKERRALIVRAGHQLRPAHILAEGFTGPKNLETLDALLRDTHTRVTTLDANGREVVDVRASLEKVADLHARTAAELYRYRILHGGLSPGNKGFDGGMLDLGTITPQPRTAPVHVLNYKGNDGKVRSDLQFETENEWRVRDLKEFHKVLKTADGKPGYQWSDIDVGRVYESAYRGHMELQLLEASGLKPEAAKALQTAEPDLVKRYAQTLRRLGALSNQVDMNIETSTVKRGSVVDIYNALRGLPGVHFGGGDVKAEAWKLLAADADKPAQLEKAKELTRTLSELYGKVLDGGRKHGGQHYDGKDGFVRSVTDRAEFENKPLSDLYRSELGKRLKGLIAKYESTGDPTELRRAMESLMSNNVRDVENLLGRDARKVEGGIETNREVREGLEYAFRSANEGARTIRVELPLAPVEGVGYRFVSMEVPNLSGAETDALRYRYTFDGWKTHAEVTGKVVQVGGQPTLRFEVPVKAGAVGELQGSFKSGERWFNNGGRNYTGYRFAAPDKADMKRLETRAENPELGGRGGPGFGRGFGPRRRAASTRGPRAWARSEVERVFRAVRDASLAPTAARGGSVSRVGTTNLAVEISPDIDARYDPARNQVRLTTGLLDALASEARGLPAGERAAFFRKALGLVVGHELAHSGGIKAERVADAEGLATARKALGEIDAATAKRTLDALASRGRVPLVERITSFLRYGSAGGRAASLERAARGEADPLAKYRRADGTLEWKRVTADRALKEVKGLAHFGLALFLKELAVVARSGDSVRIEEFFDGLMTTDFYKHYGLFVLGARVGDVAYARYLQRYLKPRFVSGVLRTNVALATGMALPQLVSGTFEGKAFAISLGSLGLSSAAVRTGAAGIKWVVDLKRAKNSTTLARAGLNASRLAKVGGFFYTVAELAVVLYLADEIDQRVNAYLDRRAAQDALAKANHTFTEALARAKTPADVTAAAEAYGDAWTSWRDYLYRPLHVDEAVFAQRLQKVARKAKIKADERNAAVKRLGQHAALRRRIESKYGSLEAYAASLTRRDEAALAADVAKYTTSYNKAREEHLREVYQDHRRSGSLLNGVPTDERGWLLLGGRSGATGEPHHGRNDLFARKERERLQRDLADAIKTASPNRLQAYEDEAEVLAAAAAALRARGGPDLAEALDDRRRTVLAIQDADQRLAKGKSLPSVGGEGARGALERSGD